ncbi:MAG TPA: tetratricopeptide repeat protein [Pyrinomonadaceae bacterium]|nr:tetratricopeptide repeat protein [Pyrinomonadaceae bacterium]
MRLLLTIVLSLLATTFSLLQQRQAKPTLTDEFAKRTPPPASAEATSQMEARLSEARNRYEAEPNNPEAAIWFGRRLAYLGRFSDAIEVYSLGIKKFPRDARLYRHRGHRYITLRKFDLAIADFHKAASLIKGLPDEVEPDGQPNARNIPTSTLQFNIWYHLGLAQYLTGRYQAALSSYRECLKVSENPDSIVATTHWLYMTLRRLNRPREAAQALTPITPKMDIIENDGYYKLTLMYKGLVDSEALLAETLKQSDSPGSHSVLYGIANWHFYNGRSVKAAELLRRITSTDQWTSFGFIAAEVDLTRMKPG